MFHVTAKDFKDWRDKARRFIAQNIPPQQIQWQNHHQEQTSLFGATENLPPATETKLTISKDFIALAERIACHTDPQRWDYLYQALWRLCFEQKNLLKIASDPLVLKLHLMEKAIRFDAHKTKAFVRFRCCPEQGEDHYIAWHNPDHNVLRLVVPFFQRRFAVMKWTIMTPFETVSWDGETLQYSSGVPHNTTPDEDSLEDMWRTYYRSTFNPARIKLKMMKREMPVRHWKTLPETSIIPSMLQEAEQRVATMLAHQEGLSSSALLYLPQDQSLPSLREAAEKCRGCSLYLCASRVVFGKGPATARIMIIGEQPGDHEDRAGEPFIGPAGQLLTQAMQEAGLDRSQCYLTNAVKHFGFKEINGRRQNITPTIREINACKPWLEAEIATVKPEIIVCLGLTAVRSLTGNAVKMQEQRGQWQQGDGHKLMISYHPSAILRQPDPEQKARLYQQLVGDLKMIVAASS